MKSSLLALTLLATVPFAFAQSGSGAPSSSGQSPTSSGEASADHAVQGRHDKAVARSKARSAKRATKAASGAGHP